MASFFKLVGKGILYALGLPFFVVALCLYSIYCLIMFIYEAIRSLFVYFSGGTPFGDLKEDVKAKQILLQRQNQQANQQSNPQPQIYIFQQGTQPGSVTGPHPLDFGEINFDKKPELDNKERSDK